MNGIGSHTKPNAGAKDEWLTPLWLIQSLGVFDLDPCSPINRPWDTARRHLTIEDDGLAQSWDGRVWLNPPYGPNTGLWLDLLAEHGDGIALVFARTETDMFFRSVWEKADAVYFLRGRLTFHHVDGRKGISNSGGPSVLVAYGANNADVLAALEIPGQFVRLKHGAQA